MTLEDLLVPRLLGYVLVFARIGAAMSFLPGIGETAVPVRVRLVCALAVSAALLPATPLADGAGIARVATLALLIASEAMIGLWIGLSARILLSALQFAGFQIGTAIGLSNAFAPGLGSFEGSTMVASGLLIAGVALIFATDLHHLIVAALLRSYVAFPPGHLPAGDLAAGIAGTAAASFRIGLSITAPFYVMGLLLNLGLGLANRAMPTLPVFFVAVPLLMAAGLVVLAVSGPTLFDGFLGGLARWLGTFEVEA
ncbi:flagellar biosynthetic protein FliR [Jannaschia sp. Os4]|uniref:flagellar biosynthetic protein FliR n=1 Tax=Jannaschia sp. Os4 TaxID=2807617 RepID=UPI00193A2F28|nr:flagellar biosynthetic protein FliR [Jannaschia sp. Os4]MBM2575662.1 flagellar biosynthetic protein FliR [Jannaschia sp. Os4]